MIRKVPENALVEGERFVGAAEFAVRFREPENCCRGKTALFVGFGDDGFVFLDCGREVVFGFLFEEAFLQALGNALGGDECA